MYIIPISKCQDHYFSYKSINKYMINVTDVSDRIYKILKGFNYSVKMYDEKANATSNPDDARRFFASPDQIFIAIWEDKKIKVYIGSAKTIQDLKPLLNTLRKTAVNYGLGYTLSSFNRKIKPKDFSPMIQQEIMRNKEMRESMYGTTKSSYENVGSVRVIVRHSDSVKEGLIGARGRNIRAIFIETKEGERRKYPYNHMNGARAMARHMNSGSFSDDVGTYIQSLSEELLGLSRVSQHIRRNQKVFVENEEINGIYESIRNRMEEVRHEVSKMSKKRGYPSAVANIGVSEEKDNNADISSLVELMNIPEDDEKMIDSLKHVARFRLVEEDPEDYDDYDYDDSDSVDTSSIDDFENAIDNDDSSAALSALGIKKMDHEMDQQRQDALMLILKAYGPFEPDKQSKQEIMDAVDQLVSGNIKRRNSSEKSMDMQPTDFKDKFSKLSFRVSNVAATIENDFISNIMMRAADKLENKDDPIFEPVTQEEAEITTKILGIINETRLKNYFNRLLIETYPQEIKDLYRWAKEFNTQSLLENSKLDRHGHWIGREVVNEDGKNGEVIDILNNGNRIRVLWEGGYDTVHDDVDLSDSGESLIVKEKADIPADQGENLWDEVLHKKSKKDKKSNNFGNKSPVGSTDVGPHKYFRDNKMETKEGYNDKEGYKGVDKDADLTNPDTLPDYLKKEIENQKKNKQKSTNEIVEQWNKLKNRY